MTDTSWDDPAVQEQVASEAAAAEAVTVPAADEAPAVNPDGAIPGQGIPAGDPVPEEPEAPVPPGSVRMKVAAPHSGLQVGFAGPEVTNEWTVLTDQQAAVIRNAAVEQGVEIIEEGVTP